MTTELEKCMWNHKTICQYDRNSALTYTLTPAIIRSSSFLVETSNSKIRTNAGPSRRASSRHGKRRLKAPRWKVSAHSVSTGDDLRRWSLTLGSNWHTNDIRFGFRSTKPTPRRLWESGDVMIRLIRRHKRHVSPFQKPVVGIHGRFDEQVFLGSRSVSPETP